MHPLVLIQQQLLPSGVCFHGFAMYIRYQSNVTHLHTRVSVPSKNWSLYEFVYEHFKKPPSILVAECSGLNILIAISC
jgi:hypothetical protein